MYLCIINPIVLLFLRNLSLPQGVSFAGIGGQLHRNIHGQAGHGQVSQSGSVFLQALIIIASNVKASNLIIIAFFI